MQISDLVNQYASMAGRKENMTGTKGVQKLVSTVRDMSSGNIFEGTVSSVKGSKVVLALSNGQKITARLDGKVNLSEGQSMFFQVKSNDGSTLAIRPYTVDGNSVNLTLMNALQAAGLPMDGRNMTMVNTMMQQQMPIDANSVNQMAKVVSANEKIHVQTIVLMQKLNIPITEEYAAQLENYMDDKQAISQGMEEVMDRLPEIMTKEEIPEEVLKQINGKILTILTDGVESSLTGSAETGSAETGSAETESAVTETATTETAAEVTTAEAAVTEAGTVAEEADPWSGVKLSEHSILRLLTGDQQDQIKAVLLELPGINEHPTLLAGGRLNLGSDSFEVLNAIKDALLGKETIPREVMKNLFSDEGVKLLMKDVLRQQWTIEPGKLEGAEQINRLYEKLENQMSRMEAVVKAAEMEHPAFSSAVADVRSNISFMNQINQVCTYVQIPLQMNGQSASGELYVYTNKKQLSKEEKKELTAFLHLELDYLGSTDVSVRLRGKDVDTDFFFDNDDSFQLVKEHLPELEKRLEEKGYHCKISVTNEKKNVNFVEDFLMKDQPAVGQLHRYSFDMRA